MSKLDEQEQKVLEDLAQTFLSALSAKNAGDVDEAEELLRSIISTEPRLAEPHMELARVYLDTERVEQAEPHAREALEHLEAGSQWTDDLPENTVSSMAHALLAEVLRRRADTDTVIFGDPEEFRAMVAESKQHFARAAELDPSDAHASYYAFFMGPRKPPEPAPSALTWSDPGEA